MQLNYLQLFLSAISTVIAGSMLYFGAQFVKSQRMEGSVGAQLTAQTLKQESDKVQLQKGIDEVKAEVQTNAKDTQRTLADHGAILAVLKDRSDHAIRPNP